MKKLLDQNAFLKPPRVDDIIKGTVIGSGRSSLFINLGIQGTGIIYGKEFYESKEKIKKLKIGEEVFAKIMDLENEEGYIELSLKEADKELSLEELKTKKETSETITVKILGANKGGLLAKVFGLPAFLPVSQLAIEHYPRVEKADKSKILKELQKFVGQELKVKIFDLDLKEKKMILSEKARDSEKIKEILKKYKVGDVVEGEISGIVDFGAFIRFPLLASPPSEDGETESASPKQSAEAGSASPKQSAEAGPNETLEGLIHISELDWQMVDNPSKILSLGQKVKAKIVEISDNRISLSLKALKKDPWQDVEQKYKKGDIIKGEITKFNPFGAFVSPSDLSSDLSSEAPRSGAKEEAPRSGAEEEALAKEGASGIQGLVHISEFGSQKKMEDLLKIGQEYDFEILQIESKEHKMILKLKS